MSHSSDSKAFYNDFSRRVLVNDFRFLNLRQEAIKSLCSEYIPAGSRVLDVGCGVGIIARHLQTTAREVLAVDISEENVKIASAYAGSAKCTVRVLDVIEQVDELKTYGEFDAAVLPDVLEHIPKEAYTSLFAAIESVLSENGRIVMTFPTPEIQRHMAEHQVDDTQLLEEEIEIEDILNATTLRPLHFSYKSILETNDYVHFVLARVRPYAHTRSHRVNWIAHRLRKYRWRLSNYGFVKRLRRILKES
jgi:trans-aconitate 2-methyltransferase